MKGSYVNETGGIKPPVKRLKNPETDYFMLISSTSNNSVAFGGITPPAPRDP